MEMTRDHWLTVTGLPSLQASLAFSRRPSWTVGSACRKERGEETPENNRLALTRIESQEGLVEYRKSLPVAQDTSRAAGIDL